MKTLLNYISANMQEYTISTSWINKDARQCHLYKGVTISQAMAPRVSLLAAKNHRFTSFISKTK